MNKWLRKQSVQRSIYGFVLLLNVLAFIQLIRHGSSDDVDIAPRFFSGQLRVDYYTFFITIFVVLLWQIVRNDLIGWIVVVALYLHYMLMTISSVLYLKDMVIKAVVYGDEKIHSPATFIAIIAIILGILAFAGYVLYKIRPSRWI